MTQATTDLMSNLSSIELDPGPVYVLAEDRAVLHHLHYILNNDEEQTKYPSVSANPRLEQSGFATTYINNLLALFLSLVG